MLYLMKKQVNKLNFCPNCWRYISLRAGSTCGIADIVWAKKSRRRGEWGEWEGKESLHGKPPKQHLHPLVKMGSKQL